MKVKLLSGSAIIPQKANPFDAGYDLYSVETKLLPALDIVKIKTDIAVEIPDHCVGIIKDRSSLASFGVHVLAGVIDSGYRGEIKVVMTLINDGNNNYKITYGQAIAQLIIVPVYDGKVQVVTELSPSERGEKGFGSSDEKLRDAKMLMMDGIGKLHDLNKRSAMMCEHANENPANCNCPLDCYCKTHTCLGKSQYKARFPREIVDKMLYYKYIDRTLHEILVNAKEKD